MTATNHFITGALIAATVQRPLLALPLAFVSHFALDVIPHYGYGTMPLKERDQKKHFILKQAVDIYFALGLFWLLPFLLRDRQAPIVTALCMFAAFVPDAIWSAQYVIAQRRGGAYKEPSAFNRFHKAIQWCENSWGIYIEIIWFVLIALGIRHIAV
ncbi:MAG: hypothetical protein JWO41_292 [Candidatus Saccharibacteria bacterium]|nr:hypothetical protein [Candidatus Saccharibacteria bacterium]